MLVSLGDAYAHAIPETANPPINGTVTVAPAAVEVTFSEEVVPGGTLLEVFTLGGERVDAGDSAVDLEDPERRRTTVALVDGIEPGGYLVQWTSESAIDEDIVSGSFRFTFDPSATPIAAVPARASADHPTAQAPAPAESPAESSGNSGDYLPALLIGLAVVAVSGFFALIMWRGGRVGDTNRDPNRS
jgi:methionine-rich copper-binding protein CopC